MTNTNRVTDKSATDPENVISEMYDRDTLHEIAMHGCASGAAYNHVTAEDSIEFYKQYKNKINDFLENLEHASVEELCAGCETEQDSMVRLCWMFIECLATMWEDE